MQNCQSALLQIPEIASQTIEMATEKNPAITTKTIAVPAALRKKIGSYAEDRDIHIYEAVERAWNALEAAESAPNGVPGAVLPLAAESQLQKAETALRAAGEAIRAIRELVPEVPRKGPKGKR